MGAVVKMIAKVMAKICIAVAIVAAVACLSIYLIRLPWGMVLIAKNNVLVFSTIEQAMARPNPIAMAVLPHGQRVSVVECIDVKSYMIYKVRLSGGHDGFVLDGDYVLMRNDKPAFCR